MILRATILAASLALAGCAADRWATRDPDGFQAALDLAFAGGEVLWHHVRGSEVPDDEYYARVQAELDAEKDAGEPQTRLDRAWAGVDLRPPLARFSLDEAPDYVRGLCGKLFRPGYHWGVSETVQRRRLETCLRTNTKNYLDARRYRKRMGFTD